VKTPPPQDRIVTQPVIVDSGRDRRFLLFVGVALVALAMGFKSEMVAGPQVWGLGAGLLVLAVPALLAYLRSEEVVPPLEHFIPVSIGALAVAGLSLIVPEWWKYIVVVVAFGVVFYIAGRLDYNRLREREKPGHLLIQEIVLVVLVAGAYLVVLASPFTLPTRLILIFVISFAASYRSFRVMGNSMPARKSVLFALFVAQVVSFFSWAMTVYLPFQEGLFAALLVFLWYMNRGIIRHAYEESLNRAVLIEYAVFGVLLAYAFFSSSQAPR
jgi:hypothetical protein